MQSSTIAACGLALLCLLAGCDGNSGTPTYTDPPVDDRVETVTTTATATATPFEPTVDGTAQSRSFLETVRGRNLGVKSVQTRSEAVHVRYEAVNDSEQREQAAFYLALAYGSAVNDTWSTAATWNASRMDAIAVDDADSAGTSFRMPAYWGHQTATGTINASELAARLQNATENRTRSDDETVSTAKRTALRETVTADANATVADLTQRGRTVFLTLETETSDDALKATLETVTEAYGNQETAGWNTSALEVTVRDADGELYGWYRVESGVAVAVAAGTGSVPGGVLEGVYREHDALEPAQ